MKRILLSLLFALVALTGLQAQTIWDGTADTSWYNETSAWFEISTAEQLAGLAKLVNNGNDFSYQTVRLTADIVLNNTSEWENWESSAPANTWTPIGNSDNYFRGTFDGQGYTVSGIYINSANGDQGLFGYNQGTIKNIGVTESYIKGEYSVGGVCSSNFGIISNCYNSGTVSGNRCVGGVCSSNYVTISNCYNTGTISGYEEVGGVCSGNNGTISNCYNSGTVSGNYYVGGVCGDNGYGTISGCYNAGTVSGNDYNVGGVCSSNYGTISNCYNSGTVSGNRYVGGVCSENNGTISNCYYLQGTAEGGINGSDISGQAEVKTAEQFASGEVCWLLNGSSDENPVWFQAINTDECPVLDNTHGTVYAIGNCPGSIIYNNDSGSSHIGEHADNDHDFRCDYCGMVMLQEPELSDGVYQISNRAELYWFAGLVNGSLDGVEQNAAANAVLTADIIINENVLDSDGNLTTNIDGLLAWVPIGANWNIIFGGTFDGQGHTVSGIYINSENDYQGLFGYNGGTIKYVGITESYIKGDDNVGGVCGCNDDGTISNCYNSGTVSGTGTVGGVCGFSGDGTISNCYNTGTINGDSYVGGVCGKNYNGTISNCYNSGTVIGNYYVGGVCGENEDSYATNNEIIINCYNSGNVSGNYDVGGVCGWNKFSGTISNCYYLEGTATSGIDGSDVSGQAEIKTAEQFASGEVCWLLNRNSDNNPTWFQSLGNDIYPILDNSHAIVHANGECPNSVTTYNNIESNVGDHTDNDNDGRCDFCGNILISEPAQKDGIYQIGNRAELYWFAGLVNGTLGGVEQNSAANAVLIADIIINENVLEADGSLTENSDNLFVWTPIGTNWNNEFRFYGSFDGQGHTVSGVYINSDKYYQGLFGSNNGSVKNVSITNSYIKGNSYVGGVCGLNYGTISNCYNSGTVNGSDDYVGGVCGYNFDGTISDCYNSGTVSGNWHDVGGVCGRNYYGSISNCYNSGIVSGIGTVGGVCGYNEFSTISNCYNSGSINGTGEYTIAGGVCGFNTYSTISNSYNTGTISGYEEVGGLCGYNNGTISNCYNTGNVNGTGESATVGGMCGYNSSGTISNCYNSGNVNGTGESNSNVGGICGYNGYDYDSAISNCYNTGNVNGTGESAIVGGVCGANWGTISDCYNTGTINGSEYIGGVCGSGGDGTISNCYNSGDVRGDGYVGGVCGGNWDGTISNCYYLEGTATGGINGSDVSGQAEAKTAEQFASGEVCWLLNEEQSEGAWGQKLGTDPCPVLGGPAVFKDGETYYNEEGSAIVETNSEQASFVIVSENLTIKIYGSDHEATVYNLAGNIVYQGSERIIPVPNPGIYMVRIGNEVQKTIVR